MDGMAVEAGSLQEMSQLFQPTTDNTNEKAASLFP